LKEIGFEVLSHGSMFAVAKVLGLRAKAIGLVIGFKGCR